MQEISDTNKLITDLYGTSPLDQQPFEPLTEESVDGDPFKQFCKWFQHATTAGIIEPYTMALATTSSDRKPSVRMLLLKSIDNGGFTFFSNYSSRKGRELTASRCAEAVFYWQQINRQVRISGVVNKLPPEESDEYFQNRSRDSQLGAWISPQSSPIANRAELETSRKAIIAMFGEGLIPRPPFWGGYRLQPNRFEFWQRRPHRLHDRIVYEANPNKTWTISRLAP